MKLRLFALSLTAAAFAFAQNPITADSPAQVKSFSNLSAGDSVINITNTGARTAGEFSGTSTSIPGTICVNVYTFSSDEQEVSCCSCPVTPDGLVSLSVKNDLISNTLTPAVPTSVTVKLVATVPIGNSCNNSAANFRPEDSPNTGPAVLSPGLAAWGTGLHAGATAGSFAVTETAFTPFTLSPGAHDKMAAFCNFAVNNGSSFGICRSCRLGGLGANASNQ